MRPLGAKELVLEIGYRYLAGRSVEPFRQHDTS